MRNPYSSVKLIQMKWKGMVSQPANAKIAIRLTAEKTAHTASSNAGRKGQLSLMANLPSPEMRLGEAAISRRQAGSPHRAPS